MERQSTVGVQVAWCGAMCCKVGGRFNALSTPRGAVHSWDLALALNGPQAFPAVSANFVQRLARSGANFAGEVGTSGAYFAGEVGTLTSPGTVVPRSEAEI